MKLVFNPFTGKFDYTDGFVAADFIRTNGASTTSAIIPFALGASLTTLYFPGSVSGGGGLINDLFIVIPTTLGTNANLAFGQGSGGYATTSYTFDGSGSFIGTLVTTGAITGNTINLNGNSAQIVLDADAVGGITTTIQDSASGTAKIFTLPNITGTAIVDTGTQTIGGAKTFSSNVTINKAGPQLNLTDSGGNDFAVIVGSGTFTFQDVTDGVNFVEYDGTTLSLGSEADGKDLFLSGVNTVIGVQTSDTIQIFSGDGATAPSTSIGAAIVNFYGSSATNFLGTPNRWRAIKGSDGNTYKIPCYS